MSAQPFNFPCTNCGAHLVVDGSTQTPVCTYCHTQTLLPEQIWTRFHPNPAPVFSSPRVSAQQKKIVLGMLVGPFILVVVISILVIGVIGVAIWQATNKPPPIGSVGDSCSGRTHACSLDKKADLSCDANDKLAVETSCKGPNGCRVSSDGHDLKCDATFADVNDPCESSDDACATDHKSELMCVAGKFSVRATCKGEGGCTLAPGKNGSEVLSCDDHIASVGDPCFDAERTACTADHKSLLTCTAQKFVVDRACKGPKGCTMTKDVGAKTVTVDCD